MRDSFCDGKGIDREHQINSTITSLNVPNEITSIKFSQDRFQPEVERINRKLVSLTMSKLVSIRHMLRGI